MVAMRSMSCHEPDISGSLRLLMRAGHCLLFVKSGRRHLLRSAAFCCHAGCPKMVKRITHNGGTMQMENTLGIGAPGPLQHETFYTDILPYCFQLATGAARKAFSWQAPSPGSLCAYRGGTATLH